MVLGGHFKFFYKFFIIYLTNLIGLIYWLSKYNFRAFLLLSCHWKLKYKLILVLPKKLCKFKKMLNI